MSHSPTTARKIIQIRKKKKKRRTVNIYGHRTQLICAVDRKQFLCSLAFLINYFHFRAVFEVDEIDDVIYVGHNQPAKIDL